MKILFFGKNGQLGFELQRSLSCLGKIFAVGRAECDVTNETKLRMLICKMQPDVIVNSAAYTDVDKAENEVELAFAVNAHAPEIMAEEASKLNILLVHYSTDYVFDGCKVGAYVETDFTNPQSVYGKTKLASEIAIRKSHTAHLIFRTSWVFGAHWGGRDRDFIRKILKFAKERENLNVVADQFGAPTSASLLADVTAHAVLRYWLEKSALHGATVFPYGLYHVAASGKTTRYEYAKLIVKAALNAKLDIKLKLDQIKAIQTKKFSSSALRPANSNLDCTLLQKTFGLAMPQWQEGLNHVLQQLMY